VTWWAGLPPAQVQVSCGGQEHRLRWADGQLQALDHADLEGEQILVALGASCRCVEVLRAWDEHAADLRVLLLASRGPADPIRPLARPRRRPDSLSAVLDLGPDLRDRLAATVAAAWRDRLRDGAEPDPRLAAALYGRLLAALRAWTGQPDLRLELTMVPEGQPPALTGAAGLLRAEFAFGWIIEVWAKGLVTVLGRFCLAAVLVADHRWELSVVGPELGEPELIRLSRD
jgi:hypothetical protein